MKLSYDELAAIERTAKDAGFTAITRFLQSEINSKLAQLRQPRGDSDDLRLLNEWRGMQQSYDILTNSPKMVKSALDSLDPETRLKVEAGRVTPPAFEIWDDLYNAPI